MTLVQLTSAHLPHVRPWFDDPEVRRWLGGPEWVDAVLDQSAGVQPGETYRGAVVLGRPAFVLLDDEGRPAALIAGEIYDRQTIYAGEGAGGSEFVDAPGPHRRTATLAVVVDPIRRRQGWASRIVTAFMAHPDLATAEVFEVGIEPDNFPSRRLFERLGFVQMTDEPDWEGMLEYLKTVTE